MTIYSLRQNALGFDSSSGSKCEVCLNMIAFRIFSFLILPEKASLKFSDFSIKISN
jgi:hypothetical protein